jgi:hypothetical protein
MFSSDFNQIYFIATFPQKSPVYYTEIRPLEGESGQTDLTEIIMEMSLERKSVNYSRLN